MGELENPLPEVDQRAHPLRILSQENLTVVSTFAGWYSLQITVIKSKCLFNFNIFILMF